MIAEKEAVLTMPEKHEISRDDIISMDRYAAERKERRRALVETKKNRRVEVGPVCTFYFENYDTMWNQIHEMLFIEKGGEEQIEDELRAYNPLVPKGRELVASGLLFRVVPPGESAEVEMPSLDVSNLLTHGRPYDLVERRVRRTYAAGLCGPGGTRGGAGRSVRED